jgi:hypothetical protein
MVTSTRRAGRGHERLRWRAGAVDAGGERTGLSRAGLLGPKRGWVARAARVCPAIMMEGGGPEVEG